MRLVFSLLLLTGAASAQVPETDIWLLKIQQDETGWRAEGEPENLTSRPGYDNQPQFLPGGQSLVYTRMDGEGDTAQTDIYQRTIASASAERLFQTPESEYSPTPLPDGGFSVVRVEEDGTQRLWMLRAGEAPRLLFPDIQPVGYHAWFDQGHVGFFLLGEPHWFGVRDPGTGALSRIADNIGRGMQAHPQGGVTFVQLDDQQDSVVMHYRPGQELQSLTMLPGKSQDFAWLTDDTLVSTDASRVLVWSEEAGWQLLADLKTHGITQLTRVAVSPDGQHLALVNTAEVKEVEDEE